MKNIEILSVSKFLDTFKDKKVPFSICIAKNIKKISEVVSDYNEKRFELIQKYATVDENGNLLGKIGEDGKRIENPQTFDQLEVEDINLLISEINKLDFTDVDFELEPIDMNKVYYDTELNEKSTVENYIDSNIEPSVINAMAQIGLIEF